MEWFRGKDFRRPGQAERTGYAAALAIAALLSSVPAVAGPLRDSEIADLFDGTVVVGRYEPADGPWLAFREVFDAGGTVAGTAGPPDDPERYAWSGTWTVARSRPCIHIAATNSRECRRLEHFQAKCAAVRRPKMRRINDLERLHDSVFLEAATWSGFTTRFSLKPLQARLRRRYAWSGPRASSARRRRPR